MERRDNKSERVRVTGAGVRNPRARQRALCIGISEDPSEISELHELLRTAGVAVVGDLLQLRDDPHPDSYFGRGKLIELKAAAKELDANVIACDDELSPRQERNVEEAVGLPVVDRTEIILDIFAAHARTAEGKLQVELAQLSYNLSRMRGLWTHLERLGGGIGTRGPGESQIETDRRLARDRITQLRRRLEAVKSSRATQRMERERAQLMSVAITGYTNAGKSSLLNALSGAEISVRSRLFETLDPTSRTVEIDGREVVITDTVGFIRKLPHKLVEAFSATLEETRMASAIVHVVDASAQEDELDSMLQAVNEVLVEIGVEDRPTLLVLNKCDLLDPGTRDDLLRTHRGAIAVSALTGEGLDEFRKQVGGLLRSGLEEVDLLIPYKDGGKLAELHTHAADVQRSDEADGVHVHARLPASIARRFDRFAVGGPT